MNYFLKQFAETTLGAHIASHSLGTMTEKKSIEGSDQDEQTQSALAFGTMTITESIEGQDQDRSGYL